MQQCRWYLMSSPYFLTTGSEYFHRYPANQAVPAGSNNRDRDMNTEVKMKFPGTLHKSIVQTFLSKPVHSSTYGMALSCNEAQCMFNREIDTWLWHSAKHCRDNVQLLTMKRFNEGIVFAAFFCLLLAMISMEVRIIHFAICSVVSSTWFVSPYHQYYL